MRLVLCCAILAIVGLAGCSEPASGPDTDPGQPTADQPAPHHFANGTLAFTLTQVETPATDFSDSASSCWMDAPEVTQVLNATFVATWTPTNLLAERLRLAVISSGTGIVSVFADDVVGPSPLQLTVANVPVPVSLSIQLQPEEPGAVYEQDVELTWTTDYIGVPATQWSDSSC